MNPPKNTNHRHYKSSFIINTAIGTLMLLLSAASYVLEVLYPALRGTLAWWFMFTAVVSLFIASLHYSKYLSLMGTNTAAAQPANFRRTSTVRWFGLPLYDICFQQDPNNPRMPAIAKGVLAVGVRARGVVAAGVEARGVFAFGVLSIGVVSIGVCSIGLVLAGGTLALAPIAFGVQAIGLVAAGVSAIGWKVLFSVG
jgi:hypothetical protein